MIEWKLFWTLLGAALSISAALLSMTESVPVWAIIPVIITAVVAVVLIGQNIIDSCRRFADTATWQRRRIWIGTNATAATYAAWTITASLVTPTWQTIMALTFALVIITVGTYWGARGLEWRLTHVAEPARVTQPSTDPLLTKRELVMAAALDRAGYGYARVLPDATRLRDNAGWKFRLRTQSTKMIKKDQRTGASHKLSSEAAEPIAIALQEITGKQINSDWVRIRKEKGAGIYSMTVLNFDVMAEVIPYVDDPTPTSITTPALVGIEIDGTPRYERLDSHQRDIGSTRSGKSSLLHLKLAHLTRCEDAIVWIGGTEKVYDLVAGWIEPYENTGLRPPIDWIANGVTDTLHMMTALMRVARWRQAQPYSQRKWRTIILILDEFSFAAENTQIRIEYDHDHHTVSGMAANLLRGAASGQGYAHFATQQSTIDNFGTEGSKVIANMHTNHAFASKDFAEVGRLTGDYALPIPTHKGEFYSFGEDADVIHLKAPYIQTTDPSKPKLHDGATVSDIAWSRRHIDHTPLTVSEGAEAAGDAYAQRHQYVDAAYLDYLTSMDPTPTSTGGNDTARKNIADKAYEREMAKFEQELAEAGIDIRPDTEQPKAEVVERAPAIVVAAPRESRDERICRILTTADDDGMNAQDIAEALAGEGDKCSTAVVSSTLSRLARAEKIQRVSTGHYTA